MADPVTVDVYVELSLNKQRKLDFRLHGGHLLEGDQLVFRNSGHPGFIVNFRLLDPHGTGFVFPHDHKAALSSARIRSPDDECPKKGQWGIFKSVDVKDSNRTLVVRNINNEVALFGFTLWVTDNPNSIDRLEPLDPVGSNQNGPSSRSSLSLSTAAVIGAAAGAASALALIFALDAIGVIG